MCFEDNSHSDELFFRGIRYIILKKGYSNKFRRVEKIIISDERSQSSIAVYDKKERTIDKTVQPVLVAKWEKKQIY